MEISSSSSPSNASPVIHLAVTKGEHEATLADPSVLYLLKQKRDEGLFTSPRLSDLLAPNVGVKIKWSNTNRIDVVEASSIRIIPAREGKHHQGGNRFLVPPKFASEEARVNGKRLISTLRKMSSVQNFPRKAPSAFHRWDLPPASLRTIPSSLWSLPTPDNNNQSNWKAPRSYSAWLQESPTSSTAAPEIPTSIAALVEAAVLATKPTTANNQNKEDLSINLTPKEDVSKSSNQSNTSGQASPNTLSHVVRKDSKAQETPVEESPVQATQETKLKKCVSYGEGELSAAIAARSQSNAPTEVTSNSTYQTTGMKPKDGTTTPTSTTSTNATNEEVDPEAWELMYQRLVRHMKARGMDKVPTRIQSDPELRKWVAKQRQEFKKGNLTSERQYLLRSVGFHRDKFTLKWDAKFERLRAFQKEHGHTNVPFHYAKDRQLGTWVSKQRVRIRKGTISEEDRVRLESIGFVPNRFTARWEEMFRRLVNYKKVHGDANVPRSYSPDPELAHWALNQKDSFREGRMKPDRQIMLEAIGFSWSTFCEGDTEWEDQFSRLLVHKAVHGNMYKAEAPKLARWVALQQSLHNMGTLVPHRAERLVSIGAISPAVAAPSSSGMLSSMAQQRRALVQPLSGWNPNENTTTFL